MPSLPRLTHMKKSDGDAVKDDTTLPPDAISLENPTAMESDVGQPVVKPAPDGGIGWLVLFSAFSISMLVDGVCFSFGIFFDDFRDEFKTTKATTSWIGSVLNGSYLIVGPLVSALVNVYGCRRVAMTGAVMATVAFLVSTFSTSIGFLILTYGFLGGVGFGLMYLPSIVIVGYYFEKRRALATGIACCGSGIGAFVFAPFTEYLLYVYSWRGALWILSGLVLHGFLFGIFYKPLPQGRQAGGGATPSPAPKHHSVVPGATANEEESSASSNMLVAELNLTECSEKGAKKTAPMTKHTDLTLDIPTPVYRTRSVTLHGLEAQDYQLRATSNKDAILRMTQSQDLTSLNVPKKKPKRLAPSPLQRKDIFYSGSVLHLKELVQDHGSMDDFRREMLTRSPENGSLGGDQDTLSQPTQSLSQAVINLFDFSLLKSPTFLIYGMSCFLCMAGFFVPFIYMPTHAMDMGYDGTQGALLISIIGITNTVGRVAVGFISDQPWADCLLINNVALAIGGIATIFVPFYNNYSVLAAYATVFGSSIAVFVSLRSIIMVELIGLDKLTNAFGLVIMCQGLSSLLGAPIAGTLSDITNNYDASFYMAGITLTLSGLICLPLRRVARWEQAKKKAAKMNHLPNGGGKMVDKDGSS